MKPPAFLVNLQFIEETKQLDAVSGWIGSRALMREMVQHPDCPALLREAIGLHRPVTQTRVIRNANPRWAAGGGRRIVGAGDGTDGAGRPKRRSSIAKGGSDGPWKRRWERRGTRRSITPGSSWACTTRRHPPPARGGAAAPTGNRATPKGNRRARRQWSSRWRAGRSSRPGFALSGVGRIAQRARLVEAALLGRKGSEELFTMAGQTARGEGEAPGANEEAREERRAQIDQVTREAVAAAFTVAFTVATG